MIVKLLTEHHLKFLSLKETVHARMSLTCQNATLLEISCHSSFSLLCLKNQQGCICKATFYLENLRNDKTDNIRH